jgi:hypothetical protein
VGSHSAGAASRLPARRRPVRLLGGHTFPHRRRQHSCAGHCGRPAAAGPSPVGQITASTGSTTPSAAAECINLAAGAAVKAAATAAHRQYTHLVHIQPVPGDFYYGACGGIQYAATDFEAAPGAGPPESVGLQDDGAAMQYFLRPPGGGWRHVDSDGFPRDPRGCAAITTIPSPLAVIWHGCPSNRFQPAVGQG